MKTIKKIALFLVIIFCFQLTVVYAECSSDFLKAMGITPPSYSQTGHDNIIPYDEFLHMVSKTVVPDDMAPCKTRYEDVSESNPYSGYIEFLAGMNLINDEKSLNPSSGVTANKAAAILMRVLGYTGLEESVLIDYAFSQKLFKEVRLQDGMLTYDGAAQMVCNAIDTETVTASILTSRDGKESCSYEKSGKTLLNKRFNLLSYSGVIKDVNTSKHSVWFVPEKSANGTKGNLALGNKVYLSCRKNINIGELKYAPIDVWINDNNELIYASLKKGAEIKFGLITAINNIRENAWYTPENISEISVQDEGVFDVSESASFYINEKLTQSTEQWIGRIARFVVYNDEIISVESWDLKEGGLIKESSSSQITYIKGNQTLRYTEFAESENNFVYIDGRSSEVGEIKSDSVFSYFSENGKTVLLISEGVVSDNLKTISDTELCIGGFVYKTGNTYYKTAGTTFKNDKASGEKLLGKTVKAYIGPDGHIAYVDVMSEESGNVFLGTVLGFDTPSVMSPGEFEAKILALMPQIENEIYTITEKTKFEGGLTLEQFKNSKATVNQADVYEFLLNGGKIVSVKPASWFKGYGERAEQSISSFTNQGTAMMTVNGKMLFFKNAKIVLMYPDKNGEMTAKSLPWSMLQGRSCQAIAGFYCYSENEYTSVPDMVLVNGNGVMNLTESTTLKYGLLTGYQNGINDADDDVVVYNVYNGVKNEQYSVDSASAQNMPERAYIVYRDGLQLSDNEMSVVSYIDLSQTPDKWSVKTPDATEGLFKGVVERADELRIFYKDINGESDVDFYHPSFNFFAKYNSNKPQNPFSAASYTDIQPGDTVYFYNTGEGIKGLILIK